MRYFNAIFFFLVVAAAKYASGQSIVTVINERTGKPVEGASVYISGTTYGKVADAQGQLSLAGFPVPPYKLTVSAVGYRGQTADVTPGAPQALRIFLAERVEELQEVVIQSPLKDGWERYGKEFLKSFIGYSPFAAQCRILNPQVLSFYEDIDTRTLRVSAKKPLQIRNDALGYEITYWLQLFELNFDERKLMLQGSSQFRDMITVKTAVKKKQTWLLNRESAYHGSLQHFMRSLYHGTTAAEGFEVRALRKIRLDSLKKFNDFVTDSFYIHPPQWEILLERLLKNTAKTSNELSPQFPKLAADLLLQRIQQWEADTSSSEPLRLSLRFSLTEDGKTEVLELKKTQDAILAKFYRVLSVSQEAASNAVCNILYQQVLQTDSFVYKSNTSEVKFSFQHYLHITYTREKEEEAYFFSGGFVPKNRIPLDQTSILSISVSEPLILFSNGHFEPSRELLVEGYWSYEKIDKLLPLEYQPTFFKEKK